MTLHKFLPAALVRNKPRLFGAVCACVFSLGFSTTVNSAVIGAYFGMNYIGVGVSPAAEVQLTSITYTGGGGGTFTTPLPAVSFGSPFTPAGFPVTGLPDGAGFAATPTYMTVPGGDGETTRTIGATLPIDWDMTSFAFPSIAISSITLDTFTGTIGGTFMTPYIVGLIPAGPDTELLSNLAAPQGEIYNELAGADGNSFGFTTGGFSGGFIFAAANPVPVPAAVWLFGSGLIGLVGIGRRKPRQ